MDSAQTASLAKTVLDADTVNAIERFLRDDPVDEAQALVDDILEVGIGGHFLARKSTRRMYRAGALWQPALVAPCVVRALRGDAARQGRWDRAHQMIEDTTCRRCRTTSGGTSAS